MARRKRIGAAAKAPDVAPRTREWLETVDVSRLARELQSLVSLLHEAVEPTGDGTQAPDYRASVWRAAQVAVRRVRALLPEAALADGVSPIIVQGLENFLGRVATVLHLDRAKAPKAFSPPPRHDLLLKDAHGWVERIAQQSAGQADNATVGHGLPPLTERESLVDSLIRAEGPLSGKEICNKTGIDQSSLTSQVIPILKKRGLRNRRGVGYFFP